MLIIFGTYHDNNETEKNKKAVVGRVLPTPSSPKICCTAWPMGIKGADGSEVANQPTLMRGDDPGLSWWVPCNHGALESRREAEGRSLLKKSDYLLSLLYKTKDPDLTSLVILVSTANLWFYCSSKRLGALEGGRAL